MSGDTDTDGVDLRSVFQSVIIRAICDSLGYTNLNPHKSAHAEAIREAREWFEKDTTDFHYVCDVAGMNPDQVRSVALKLIHAKVTGDHTHVPDFWRLVFAQNRMPNLTNIEKALDLTRRSA